MENLWILGSEWEYYKEIQGEIPRCMQFTYDIVLIGESPEKNMGISKTI